MHNDTDTEHQRFSSRLHIVSPSKVTVKFSPMVCVAIVASLTGEMTAQNFAYHAHGTADGDKSCCYPWFVCHDKTLNQPCSVRLTPR